MPTRVSLSRLAGLAYLESTTGTVATAGGRSRLDGAFVVVVAGFRSAELQFDGQSLLAEVRSEAGAWILAQMANRSFAFTSRVEFRSPIGPCFFCTTGSLRQSVLSGTTAQLSLDDARLTLVPGDGDPGAGLLAFRTATGNIATGLNPLAHPEDPNRAGRYVLPHPRGHVVCLGSLNQERAMGTVAAADVLIGRDCRVSFVLPASPAPNSTTALLEAPQGSTTAARAAVASRLLMTAAATTPLSRLRLSAEQIEVTGGFLRVTQFTPRNVWLAQGATAANTLSKVIALYTATSRLSFAINLTSTGEAEFRYEDPSIDLPLDPTAVEARYYGLRVAGLGSKTGVRPALDATDVRFVLSGTGIFDAKAGLPGSRLVPKPNFREPASDRRLDIPASSSLILRVSTPARPSATAMTLDTSLAAGQFRVHRPHLVAAPVGVSARSAAGGGNRFDEWLLAADDAYVDFDLASGRLEPVHGAAWLQRFHTANSAARYALIEHPGLELVIDGAPPSPPVGAAVVAAVQTNRTEVCSIQTPTGEEAVVYSALFVALSWAATKFVREGKEWFLDEKRFKLGFTGLTTPAFDEFLIRNGLQDLVVVYRAGTPNGRRQIRAFIIDTMLDQDAPTSEKFAWSLAAGLQMVLYDPKDANGPFCDQIAQARGHNYTCLGFDHSAGSALTPQNLGYPDATSWQDMARAAPALWPRASGRDGARLDPSEASWRGVFLRDIPLFFPKPEVVDETFPFLANLIGKLNKKLVLDYGWRDETGPTWSAGMTQTFAEGVFTPEKWKETLEMSVTSLRLQGAAGAVVSAEGTCELVLKKIRDKTTDKPLSLSGTFGVDLESGKNPITRIDVTQNGALIATDSLPGFASVALKRVATDFKTAQFELLLRAQPDLAQVLPFLSPDEPQQAMLSINLSGEPSGVISLALPKEIQTRLFGRWPIAVQAMSIALVDQATEMRIRVRFHLGMAEFGSVGATVVVRGERNSAGNPTLDFGVEIDDLEGSLSVGDMTLRGSLKWSARKPDGSMDSSRVDLARAAGAGQNRDLWGSISLEDDGVVGDGRTSLALRIGNRGELSFWIAALEAATSLPIGIGQLKNPALLLAHNADYEGRLAQVVTDPTGSVLAAVRPVRGTPINEWLSRWEPSSSIGSLIAGSGYVELQSMVAEAPVEGDEVVPEKLSSLLFTDRGLARIDGYMTMLGAVPLRFGLAIDYENKRILAGLQAPEIKLPPVGKPKYIISPGYITIGMSFFGAAPWLRVAIGWPERIGGTEYERDWSKAIKIHIPEMTPLNTFWGGYLAELDAGKSRVVFGFAIRAGYTNNFDILGGLGSAELGITLGGVVQFALSWGAQAQTRAFAATGDKAVQLLAGVSDEGRVAVLALELFEASVLTMSSSVDLALTGEIYGDVWGKASVHFMGVTLAAISIRAFARFRICGSFQLGITQAKAQVGFEVSVRILCVTYSTNATIDITLIEGSCPLLYSPSALDWTRELPRRFAPIPMNT